MGSFKDGFIRLLKNIVEKAEREKELEEIALANQAAALAAKQAAEELALKESASAAVHSAINATVNVAEDVSITVPASIANAVEMQACDSSRVAEADGQSNVTMAAQDSQAPAADIYKWSEAGASQTSSLQPDVETLHSLLHSGKDSLTTHFLSNVKEETRAAASNQTKESSSPVDPSVQRSSLDSSWKHIDDNDQSREQTLRITPPEKIILSEKIILPEKTASPEKIVAAEKPASPRHEIHQTRLYSGSSEEEPTLLAAQWQCTPDDTLIASNATPTEESFRKAAENVSTSPSTLAWLSSLVSPEVRATVASNAQTPPETLRKLANDVDNTVRLSVAINPSTPIDVLRTLIRDNSKLTASEAQKALSERGDVVEAERKSQNLLTNNRFNPTSNHLVASYTTLDAVVPEGINEGSKADSEWQSLNTDNARKAYKQQKDTVKDLKFNPSVATNGPRKQLPVIPSAFDKPPENASPAEQVLFYKMMATRLSTPPVRLAELAAHDSIEVRAAVAENVNSPAEAFLLLAKDSQAQVKLRVIDNSSCPANILEMLRNDPDPYVGYEAKNQLKRLTQATTYEKLISHASEGLI